MGNFQWMFKIVPNMTGGESVEVDKDVPSVYKSRLDKNDTFFIRIFLCVLVIYF